MEIVDNNITLFAKGPFKCYVTLLFWKFDTHPPSRNANNVEPHITLFQGNLTPPTADTGVARIFVWGGGTQPMPPSQAPVVHTFDAVAGSWGSVSAPPAVNRVMCGAPERKKIYVKLHSWQGFCKLYILSASNTLV